MIETLEVDWDDLPPNPGTMRLRDYQEDCLTAIDQAFEECNRILVVMATGCFQRGTRVLMSDGSVKTVETVRVGDRVIGDDGDLREVVALRRGRESMYLIRPIKGEPHVVNAGHILTLIRTPKHHGKQAQVIDISLNDYFNVSKSERHRLKLLRSGMVEFHGQSELLPLSPYFMGVYLGDGSATQTLLGRWTLQKAVSITTADPEVVAEVQRVAECFGLRVRVSENPQPNKSKNYLIVGKITGRSNRPKNAVSQIIKHLGVNVQCGEKFIPESYKRASVIDRLNLLAGLIDTDGARAFGGFDYISKSPSLASDVAFVARSLGLAAYVRPCVKGCQTGAKGVYHRVSISGDCSIVPCRVERKRPARRRQIKSVLRTGFTVEQLPINDYFGFTLAGKNGRFLLADFTVSHNCGKTIIFSKVAQREISRGGRVLILAHTDELLEQAIDKLNRSTGLVAEKEKADDHATIYSQVVVGSIQTLARIARLTGFADNHFTLVICDEAHRSLANSYQRVLRYFHFGNNSLAEGWVMPEPGMDYVARAKVLGVTATADRGDKRTLGEFYNKCAFEYGLLEAVLNGYLVRPIVRNIPLKIDIRGVKTSKISGQADFDQSEVTRRIAPFLDLIAGHIAKEAHDRKTVVFTPSIETARMLAEALVAVQMDAQFVSGACVDRSEKIARYERAGAGAVICCAMLLTEGWDSPATSCVCVLRPTKIRSLFVQCAGRTTRTLPGTIDGIDTKEERLAAIAASGKPNSLIIDFLWLSDRLDLVRPVDLVATRPDVRKQMTDDAKDGDVDLVTAEMAAERDLLKNLEKAAKQHARKQARTIDPLALATAFGDATIANWEPETKWETEPPTPGQLDYLRRQGIDVANIKYKGLASKIIGRINMRHRSNLATPRQLSLMKQLGLSEETCSMLTTQEAGALLDRTLAAKKEARATSAAPQ